MIKIYCDGGTRGSRICLHDPQKNKTIIKTRGNNPTNNELEYLALLYSLEYINNNYSKTPVNIIMDSMLIVNQMNKKWRLTNENLTRLNQKCCKLMRDDIKITWVRRNHNLAGHALEG